MLWRDCINTSKHDDYRNIPLNLFISSSLFAHYKEKAEIACVCTGIKISWSASVVGLICWLYYGLAFLMVKHWQCLCSFVAKCLHQYVSTVLSWQMVIPKNNLTVCGLCYDQNMFGGSSKAPPPHQFRAAGQVNWIIISAEQSRIFENCICYEA